MIKLRFRSSTNYSYWYLCLNAPLNDLKYFISFIIDLSWYIYIFLITNKSNALNIFNIHKTEVEISLWDLCELFTGLYNCCSVCNGWYTIVEWCGWQKRLNPHRYGQNHDEYLTFTRYIWGEAANILNKVWANIFP